MHRVSLHGTLVVGALLVCACGTPTEDAAWLKEHLPRLRPLTPEQALLSFQIRQGFRLELVAAEPLVVDPIAAAYDEDGRMYVAEMRGYPHDPPPGGGPAGRVSLLADTDGDGSFDRSTVFADGLHWPSGIACWRGGIFVTAAPDILYLQDTTGDGVADVRRVVFTGFGTGKSEDIVNNLAWGLDNWIYGVSSYNGGAVRHVDRPADNPVEVRSNDFRFHPVTEVFEAAAATQGDFGHSFDSWGNRFAANAGSPVIHAVFPLRHQVESVPLARLAAPVLDSDGRVFPISRPEPWRVARKAFWSRWVDTTRDMRAQRFPVRELAEQGYVTGAAGIAIYRGSAYPEEYRGSAFTGEPAGNLVMHSVVERRGASFRANRSRAAEDFLASADNWFRPVNFVGSPDGCLHLLDMYREVIEDPSAIPGDIREHIDYYSGQSMGRIYRIAPLGFSPPEPPQLSSADVDQLVDLLAHPDGWWRETAHRLLFERRAAGADARLRTLARESPAPQGRLRALWLLDGFGLLDERALAGALADAHPALRRSAARLAGTRLQGARGLGVRLLALAGDEDPAVRFEAALALRSLPGQETTTALASILSQDPSDEWMQAAVFTSAANDPQALFEALASDRSFLAMPESHGPFKRLAAIVGGGRDPDALWAMLKAANRERGEIGSRLRVAVLAGAGAGLARSGGSLLAFRSEQGGSELGAMIDGILADARTLVAEGEGESTSVRLDAVELLGGAPFRLASEGLAAVLSPAEPADVQLAAVRALARYDDPAVGQLLARRWRSYSPAVRREAAEAILSREDRLPPLLDALDEGTIVASQLDPAQRRMLLDHPRAKTRRRVRELIADSPTRSRTQLLEAYRPAVTLPGDPASGAEVFERECATCHRLGAAGHEVGPGLTEVAGQTREELLGHILDPNAQVQSNYVNYRVDTLGGRVVTGILARETPGSVTLRRGEGIEDTVMRSQIEDLTSMGLSLMPEGLEESIPADDMADLLSYIQSSVGR